MSQRAESCGLSQKELGVPFLFTPEGECVVSADGMIDLFQNLSFEEEHFSEEDNSPADEAESN